MDVKSLYPSVPKSEGRRACEMALNTRSDRTIPTEEVIEMIDLTLENNNFEFNGKHYLQIDGTAIGSRLGMNYASAYMGEWEKNLLSKTDPQAYFRYVDDVWGIWLHDQQSLKEFHDLANSIHPRIKVDLRYVYDKIEFLDTLTKIENGFITTRLYEKPTDRHLYLHRKSDHPRSVKKSIPYELAIRAKRISQTVVEYVRERKKIKERLVHIGYKGYEVEVGLKKADVKNRDFLLKHRNKSNSKMTRVPLVLTYCRSLPNIKKILESNQRILKKSDRLRKIFKDLPIISYKRDQNLADLLVHKKTNKSLKSKSPIIKYKEHEIKGCGRNCKICTMHVISPIVDKKGNPVKTDVSINCRTQNIIYGIYCAECESLVYVGETRNMLKTRIHSHLSNIRHNNIHEPVPRHFDQSDHSIKDFYYVGLERMKEERTLYRRQREARLIQRHCLAEQGLNIRQMNIKHC